MQRLKGPAVKNMSEEQLKGCVDLGKKIAEGKASLVDLDDASLNVRGKIKGGARGMKRENDMQNEEAKASNKLSNKKPKPSSVTSSSLKSTPKSSPKNASQPHQTNLLPPTPAASPAPISPSLRNQISSSPSLTRFRKRVLLTLCQVPSGHYTTYAAISSHLSSSPRAVGNALRNNPFAPEVPCHRVVASDGGIGGFGGDWGPEGKHVKEKWKLLREEGVKVREGEGKVVGGCWSNFTEEEEEDGGEERKEAGGGEG